MHVDGTCTVGSWVPPVAGQDGVPEAPQCPTDDEGVQLPVEEESEPCCLVVDEVTLTGNLAYPADSCPTGLDGFSDDPASQYFYPNLDACNRGKREPTPPRLL